MPIAAAIGGRGSCKKETRKRMKCLFNLNRKKQEFVSYNYWMSMLNFLLNFHFPVARNTGRASGEFFENLLLINGARGSRKHR